MKFFVKCFSVIALVNYYGQANALQCYVCKGCTQVNETHIQTCGAPNKEILSMSSKKPPSIPIAATTTEASATTNFFKGDSSTTNNNYTTTPAYENTPDVLLQTTNEIPITIDTSTSTTDGILVPTSTNRTATAADISANPTVTTLVDTTAVVEFPIVTPVSDPSANVDSLPLTATVRDKTTSTISSLLSTVPNVISTTISDVTLTTTNPNTISTTNIPTTDAIPITETVVTKNPMRNDVTTSSSSPTTSPSVYEYIVTVNQPTIPTVYSKEITTASIISKPISDSNTSDPLLNYDTRMEPTAIYDMSSTNTDTISGMDNMISATDLTINDLAVPSTDSAITDSSTSMRINESWPPTNKISASTIEPNNVISSTDYTIPDSKFFTTDVMTGTTDDTVPTTDVTATSTTTDDYNYLYTTEPSMFDNEDFSKDLNKVYNIPNARAVRETTAAKFACGMTLYKDESAEIKGDYGCILVPANAPQLTKCDAKYTNITECLKCETDLCNIKVGDRSDLGNEASLSEGLSKASHKGSISFFLFTSFLFICLIV